MLKLRLLFNNPDLVLMLLKNWESEKSRANLVAELEFILYLRSKGYAAMQPLPAKSGDILVEKATVQTLGNLKGKCSEQAYPANEAAFLKGYRSQYSLDEVQLTAMPAFQRFRRLYRYTRVVRAIQERWEHEPDWLVALRTKLEDSLVREAALFGEPISNVAKAHRRNSLSGLYRQEEK